MSIATLPLSPISRHLFLGESQFHIVLRVLIFFFFNFALRIRGACRGTQAWERDPEIASLGPRLNIVYLRQTRLTFSPYSQPTTPQIFSEKTRKTKLNLTLQCLGFNQSHHAKTVQKNRSSRQKNHPKRTVLLRPAAQVPYPRR